MRFRNKFGMTPSSHCHTELDSRYRTKFVVPSLIKNVRDKALAGNNILCRGTLHVPNNPVPVKTGIRAYAICPYNLGLQTDKCNPLPNPPLINGGGKGGGME